MSTNGSPRPRLAFELDPSPEEWSVGEIELLEDVNAGRALLGAPLMHTQAAIEPRLLPLPVGWEGEASYYDRIWVLLAAAAFDGYDPRAMAEEALSSQAHTWSQTLKGAREREVNQFSDPLRDDGGQRQ